jgi:hypothetical protein
MGGQIGGIGHGYGSMGDVGDQTQLIALGRTMAVFPESARTWLWDEHAAVPLRDAPPVTTHIVWPAHGRSRGPHGSDSPLRYRSGGFGFRLSSQG